MIRKVLDSMITTCGYGKLLGQGEAPFGWPVNEIVWQGYSGATRSKLTNGQMTRLLSMLEAAHLDPSTHVKQLHLVQENDNDDR